MSPDSPRFSSRLLGASLILGGGLCLVAGALVFSKLQQPLINRGFYLLIPVFMVFLGVGKALESRQPELASKFQFTAKVCAGLALFSLSWALSHP